MVLLGGDAGGDARVAVALEAQRDHDDRIGRGRQRCPRARSAEARRGGRAERERRVAAKESRFFLAHRLLQEAQRRGCVEVFVPLRGGLRFERHRVFFADRQVGGHLGLRGIGHARRALAFRHPAHRVVARPGDRGDGAPARRIPWIEAPDTGQRIPQGRDDRIEILRRGLQVISGKAGRDGDGLGERIVRQGLLGQAQGFFGGLHQAHVLGFLRNDGAWNVRSPRSR